jgi:hypothetical protein
MSSRFDRILDNEIHQNNSKIFLAVSITIIHSFHALRKLLYGQNDIKIMERLVISLLKRENMT